MITNLSYNIIKLQGEKDLAVEFPKTSKGQAVLASEEDLQKEKFFTLIVTKSGQMISTDSGRHFVVNEKVAGYTSPNLHRRIDQDAVIPFGTDYPFVQYDEEGNAYKQTIVVGTWDGLNSYRTTTTYTHDEESETSEIP